MVAIDPMTLVSLIIFGNIYSLWLIYMVWNGFKNEPFGGSDWAALRYWAAVTVFVAAPTIATVAHLRGSDLFANPHSGIEFRPPPTALMYGHAERIERLSPAAQSDAQ